MKPLLYIIGGSGFIGKNLVRHLYNEYNITIFDCYIDHDYFRQFEDVKLSCIDLVENQIGEEYTCPEFIINLASVVTAERDLSLFDRLISTNLKILLNLYSRFGNNNQLKMFIQFGSSEEYGNAPSPYVEVMREQPASPYALVKQLTTNTALMLYSNYGFPTCIVRPGNLYGPGQPKNKFIPYVIDKLSKNEPLDVTPCEQKRDFIQVDDFATAISLLLINYIKCVGEIINISSGKSISLKSIIEREKNRLQSSSIVNYGALPYRDNEAMDLVCNIDKYKAIIN